MIKSDYSSKKIILIQIPVWRVLARSLLRRLTILQLPQLLSILLPIPDTSLKFLQKKVALFNNQFLTSAGIDGISISPGCPLRNANKIKRKDSLVDVHKSILNGTFLCHLLNTLLSLQYTVFGHQRRLSPSAKRSKRVRLGTRGEERNILLLIAGILC